MVWYKNYNWKSNPFVIDPIPDTFIIEDIRKKVEEAIYSGDILNLYGQTGTGKTSLLRAMETSMKGAFVPVYIDPLDLPNYAPDGVSDDKRQYEGFLAKLKKDALKDPLAGFKRLLGQRRTLLESLKSTYKGKKLVLLIDEAKDITDPTIPSYFRSIKNSGADCSIIITSIDPVSKLQTFADSLRDVRVSFLQMRTVSLEEAREMFTKRIGNVGGTGIEPFDEQTFKHLVERSRFTPISILRNAEDTLKYLSFNERPDVVKKEDIAMALAESMPKQVTQVEQLKVEPVSVATVETSRVPEHVRATVPFDNLTETQKKIVMALKEHPMTSSDLCKVLGIENTSLFTDIYR
ncbi:hypothetical protein KKF81_03565, partial [Candidatus Micrarchaeota archaeon]|nr:hypothetical protein [Candidatus Micrarchaeota archaeon]